MATTATPDTRATELRGQAEKLYKEAIAIMRSAEPGAEAWEQQEKLRDEARDLIKRAESYEQVTQEYADIFDAQKQVLDEEDRELKKIQQMQNEAPKFKSFGEYAHAIFDFKAHGLIDPRLIVHDGGDTDSKALHPAAKRGERKVMVESIGASGGFLVPAEFRAELMALAEESEIVRPRANVMPMTRRTLTLPVVDQTSTTAGYSHVFGGVYAKWTEEAAQKDEQDPQWRQFTVTAYKLVLYTQSSDELLDDSAISLQAYLTGPKGFPGAIAWMEDYAFFNGNGVGQPLGVLNTACGATIAVARAATNAVSYTDLVNMLESFHMSGPGGVWTVSQSAMSNLLLMSGPAGNPAYLWGNATTGVPNTLLGYPIVFSDKPPLIGTRGDVSLCDFSEYVVGDRQATTMDMSTDELFRYDKTSWRAVHRVGGAPWLSAPLTLPDGTTQVSPFVVLGDKST